MLLDFQSLQWGEVGVRSPTVTYDFDAWTCEGGLVINIGASREFETWTGGGGLILGIDADLRVVYRRRVAMF